MSNLFCCLMWHGGCVLAVAAGCMASREGTHAARRIELRGRCGGRQTEVSLQQSR
ncbi:MAG: hypothetical protein VB858_09985 [Planctomycetaceae bacterium]